MSYRWMVKDQGRDGEGDLLGRRGGQRFRHDIPRFDLEDLICRVENSILPKNSGFAVGAAVSAQDRRGDWDGGSCREGSGRSGHKKR